MKFPELPKTDVKMIRLYDHVFDKISKKTGYVVYISDPPINDCYVFEPDDWSFDPDFRTIDDLEPIKNHK